MKSYLYSFAAVAVMILTTTTVQAGTLDCTGCHAQKGSGDLRPLDSTYRNITSGAFQGNHQAHMASNATSTVCAVCHNNSAYQSSHRDGRIQLAQKIGNYSAATGRARYNTTRPAIQASGSVFFNQTSVPVLATCTNVNCHFETTTAIWGTDAVTAGMGCASCHGNPPSSASIDPLDGSHRSHTNQGIYYWAMTCAKCHPDHTKDPAPFSHATSIGKRDLAVTPVDVLNNSGQYTPGGDRKYLPSQKGSHTFGTCTNIYCHSTVQANGGVGAPVYNTVRWGNGNGCGDANGCHAVLPAGGAHVHPSSIETIATGSHSRHILSAAAFGHPGNQASVCMMCHNWSYPVAIPQPIGPTACNGCHYSGSTLIPHADGKIRIAFDGTVTTGTYNGAALVDKVPQSGYGSCENTYCHSNGTRQAPPYVSNSPAPLWGIPSTAACGSCHKATSATGFPVISSAGHTMHFTWAVGPKLGTTLTACQACHPYSTPTHVNKVVDKNPCTPCHPGTEPIWSSKQLVACEDCHGKNGTVSVMSNMSAPNKWSYFNAPRGVNGGGGHGINNVPCYGCHGQHTEPYNYGNGGLHITGARGDWQGLNRYDGVVPYSMNPSTWVNITSDGYNLCTYCHNQFFVGEKRTHVRSQGEGVNASMSCVACHDSHGAGNLHMIRSKIWYSPSQAPIDISFTNVSTYVQYGAPYQGLCQVCHTLTGHFRRGVAEPSGAGQHGSPAYRRCTSCHDHGTKLVAADFKVSYAFQPSGCDGCHGYPPVTDMTLYGTQNMYTSAKLQNYSGGGGAHTARGHLAGTVKATDANPWQPCLACHNGGEAAHTKNISSFSAANSTQDRKANVSVTVLPRLRFRNNVLPGYRLKTGDNTSNTSTCWNVNCHFQSSPRWGTDK